MNSFITWIGGKKLLRDKIIKRFPTDFNRYIEVFGGAGWVLFAKDKHANLEIYNDYDSNLVNLFRCVKYHAPELKRELSYLLNSREIFTEYTETLNQKGLTDIQRAARFFVLIKTSYGAKCAHYGCMKRNISNIVNHLDAAAERLTDVVIENRDFEKLITSTARPSAFFYLDPPYYGTEKYYQCVFSKDDHIRLCNALKGLNGKFLLSYNDCDFIRDLYKDFKIETVNRADNLKMRYETQATYSELIITNY